MGDPQDPPPRAKIGQKWPKNGQTMAIFSHNWQMIWQKENIFFNDSWHVVYGSILGPFEVLEVPKTDKLSIV